MSSHRTMMSLGMMLFALMVSTPEGAPTRNNTTSFNVLIIDKIQNKEINPNMMEEIKIEMGENKAVEEIQRIARNQTEIVLYATYNKNASNTEIHKEVIAAMKNKVHKVIVDSKKLVTSEVADEIFSYFMKTFGKDIHEEIEKAIKDHNKTKSFNVLIIDKIQNKEINPNMMEEIKIEMGENKAVEEIQRIARIQTEIVLNATYNKNASNTEIHKEVIAAMKNKVHKVIVENKKLVTSEVADEIFSYFMKTFGHDIYEEIEKAIGDNKKYREKVIETTTETTTETINHKKTTPKSSGSKESLSKAFYIIIISFFYS